jgi:hypothetical protein
MGGIIGAAVSGVESLLGGSQSSSLQDQTGQMALQFMENIFQQFQQQLQEAQKDAQS